MMEKPKFLGTNEKGEEVLMEYPDSIYVEEFTPLIDRIEKEKPELLEGIYKIYEAVGPEIFAKYFNVLIDIKKNDTAVMLITRSMMHRSMIERDYLGLIMEAFQVKSIRVVAQC